MNLLFLFVHLEARRLWRDRTLPVVLCLMALMILLAVRSGREFVAGERATITASQTEERERLLNLRHQLTQLASGSGKEPSSHGDPRKPANVGGRLAAHWATKPPVPVLATLGVGRGDLYPPSLAVTTRGSETIFGAGTLENPLFLLTGRFDTAFVLVYLFPLFVLALGYNLLSEEREGGTLSLIRSQPVALSTVLLAKTVARFVLFVIPVAVFVPVVLGLSGAFGGESVTGATGVRLVLVAGITALYGAFWLALCAATNVLRRDSVTNATVVVGAWVLLTLILPGMLAETANTLYPVPSRAALIEATRKNATVTAAKGKALLAQYYQEHPELAATDGAKSADDTARKRAVQAESVETMVAPLVLKHDRQVRAGQAFTERLSGASPVIAFAGALETLAGSDAVRQARFETQVRVFRDEWKQFFRLRIFAGTPTSAADLEALPRFTLTEAEESAVQARAVRGVLPILFFAAVSAGFAALMCNKTD